MTVKEAERRKAKAGAALDAAVQRELKARWAWRKARLGSRDRTLKREVLRDRKAETRAAELKHAEAKRALKKARKAKAARAGGPAAAVRYARKYIGVKENPAGSNRGGIITTWQQALGAWLVGLPWCGVFCAACLRAAGVKGITYRLASVAYIEDDARAGRGPFRGWTTDASRAGMGALAVIGGRGVHVELVVKTYADGSADTIGGNTTTGRSGSQSNGGMVADRSGPVRRTASEIYGFALVNY